MKKILVLFITKIYGLLPFKFRFIFNYLLSKTFKNLPNNFCSEIPFLDKNIKICNIDHSFFSFQLYCNGAEFNEPETIIHLPDLLKDKKYFIDIGSNIGQYAIYASSVSEDLKIHCFEPNQQVFKFLNQNVHNNQLQNQINIHQMAISSKKGIAELSITNSLMSSSLNPNWRQKLRTESVNIICLDSFCSENNINDKTLIKIDVEGFEEEVLKGAKKFIIENKPDIIIEILSDIDPSINDFLKQNDYHFYHITIDGFKEKENIIKGQSTGEKYLFMNYLFSTKNKEDLNKIFESNKSKLNRFSPAKIYKETILCD